MTVTDDSSDSDDDSSDMDDDELNRTMSCSTS